mgnify:FL=1
MKSFEELECYQLARALRIQIAHWARSVPKEEEFRLRDQILRAARSVTANIAEGFGRQHPQENLQFCRQARGSLCEVLDHLNVALDEGLLPADSYDSLRKEWTSAKAKLSGYITYLQSLSPKDKRFKPE